MVKRYVLILVEGESITLVDKVSSKQVDLNWKEVDIIFYGMDEEEEELDFQIT